MRIASRTRRWSLFSAVYALLLLTAGVSWAADGLPQAAIASAHPLATEAGFEILSGKSSHEVISVETQLRSPGLSPQGA